MVSLYVIVDQDTDRSGGEICEDIEAACEDLDWRCTDAQLLFHVILHIGSRREAEYP